MSTKSANYIPCCNLIETDPPACHIGRRFPEDCCGCAAYVAGLAEQERTRCEIWSRVMGCRRPTSAYNLGKQQEHRDRKLFLEPH